MQQKPSLYFMQDKLLLGVWEECISKVSWKTDEFSLFTFFWGEGVKLHGPLSFAQVGGSSHQVSVRGSCHFPHAKY